MSRKAFAFFDRGCDLEAVANDARIAQQALLFTAIVAGDALRVEAVEGGAIVLPLLQNRVPTQAGLGAFENQEFKEHAIVVLGQAPFFIVITNGQRVAGPGAAGQIGGFCLHGLPFYERPSVARAPSPAAFDESSSQGPRAGRPRPHQPHTGPHDQARAPFVTWLWPGRPLEFRLYPQRRLSAPYVHLIERRSC